MTSREEFVTTTDKKKLYCKHYMPAGKPRAILLLLHGFGAHSGRFTSFIHFLVNQQLGVVVYDQRGHGKSDGVRGYALSIGKFSEDLAQVTSIIEETYKGIPLFCYGHSFGATVLLNHCTSTPCSYSGVIVASTWFRLANQPSELKMLLAKCCRFIPVAAARTGIEPAYISRNENDVCQYLNDALVHDKLTGKLFLEIVRTGKRLSGSLYKINIPILVMHGTNDLITSPDASEKFVLNASHLTTFKLWKGYYHELHNDLDNDKVFDYVNNWLTNKLP